MESSNLEMVKRLKYTKDILTHMLNQNANQNLPANMPGSRPGGTGQQIGGSGMQIGAGPGSSTNGKAGSDPQSVQS